MASMTVADIFETLNDSQREMVYYLVGYAMDTGRNYIAGTGAFDNDKQRELRAVHKTLNEIQKAMVAMIVGEAIFEHNQSRSKGE